jgi:hypothetical protein
MTRFRVKDVEFPGSWWPKKLKAAIAAFVEASNE